MVAHCAMTPEKVFGGGGVSTTQAAGVKLVVLTYMWRTAFADD
jgi:hypothetical protein